MDGNFVVVIIFLVAAMAIVVLGLAASTSKKDIKADLAKGEKVAPISAAGKSRLAEKKSTEEFEAERRSSLSIPPPDEKRIEAIPPKNDNTRIGKGGF